MDYEKHLQTTERIADTLRKLIALKKHPHGETADVMVQKLDLLMDFTGAVIDLYHDVDAEAQTLMGSHDDE